MPLCADLSPLIFSPDGRQVSCNGGSSSNWCHIQLCWAAQLRLESCCHTCKCTDDGTSVAACLAPNICIAASFLSSDVICVRVFRWVVRSAKLMERMCVRLHLCAVGVCAVARPLSHLSLSPCRHIRASPRLSGFVNGLAIVIGKALLGPENLGPAAQLECLAPNAKAANPFLGPSHRLRADRLARPAAEVACPRRPADV